MSIQYILNNLQLLTGNKLRYVLMGHIQSLCILLLAQIIRLSSFHFIKN